MTGLGTLVNMAAILIGSGLGLLLKNGVFQSGCRLLFPAQLAFV